MTMLKLLKENKLGVILALITAFFITLTGIIFKQDVIRIIPLYVSLTVGLLQSSANRYASLIGGINSILYAVVYFMLDLPANAAQAILFSCPMQLVTFVRWSKNSYRTSTRFRRMTQKQRLFVTVLFVVCFIVLHAVLKYLGSANQLLDNLSSLLGTLILILTMFAYIEYTWLMLPSGVLSIMLNIATMLTHPGQITYVVFSIYSLICVTRGFFSVRRLYAEQLASDSTADKVKTK